MNLERTAIFEGKIEIDVFFLYFWGHNFDPITGCSKTGTWFVRNGPINIKHVIVVFFY